MSKKELLVIILHKITKFIWPGTAGTLYKKYESYNSDNI